jgi:hypothetical protein
MDFEWQGHHGPVDPSSPFHRFTMEAQHNKKRKIAHPSQWVPSYSSENRAGTHTQFDSPVKPDLPSYAPPNGKPFFFSNIPSPSPTPLASPFRAPSFTTPRKPFDVDFSSGAENSSPAGPDDNEQTPDAKSPQFEFTASPPKSKKRNSLWGMYGKFAPSPSRITRPFNDALERRIHKRRRRALDKTQIVVRRRDSEVTSSDDEDTSTIRSLKRSPSKQHRNKALPDPPPSRIASFFTFLSTNPDLPTVLSRYLQVLTNFLLLTFFLWVLYSFYATIRADVDRASDEAVSEILSEMSTCSKSYIENNCSPDQRLPALESLCSNWELCMNRDPQAVRRAALSAHTFASILNSFVEAISLKTMLFSVMVVVVSIVVSNATFAWLRRPAHHDFAPTAAYAYHQQQQYPALGYQAMPPVPQTPGAAPRAYAWQDQNKTAFTQNAQVADASPLKHIEWQGQGQAQPQMRSPSKDHHGRTLSRSRSPEKQMY